MHADPVLGPEDVNGEGVVDFRHDRVWLTGPLVTRGRVKWFRDRMEEAQARDSRGAGCIKRLFAFFIGQASRRSHERYYEGIKIFKRKRSGSWSEGFMLRSPDDGFTREMDHPLWLLGPLARLRGEAREIGRGELVGGVATTRYSLELTEADISRQAWHELAHPDSPGSDVPPRWWEPPPRPGYAARSRPKYGL